MRRKKPNYKLKAWIWFSRYTRLRYSDENGYVSCVTCGVTKHWQDGIDAGHFIPKSRGMAYYYHEGNVFPQCKRCNLHLHGNLTKYTLYMLDNYGRDHIDELEALSQTKVSYRQADYQELEKKYKSLVAELEREC